MQNSKPNLKRFWFIFEHALFTVLTGVFWINLFDKLFRQLIYPQITNQHFGLICFYKYNQNPFLGRTIIKNLHRRFQAI